MNKRKMCVLAAALIMTGLLSGCGKKQAAEQAPELLSPLSVSQSFRPVEKRDVGSIQYLQGRVMAKEYAHFFTTETSVSEILVDYGDEVEEGQVIARADTRAKEEAVKAASDALSAARANISFMNRQYEADISLMHYQRAAAEAVGNTQRVDEIDKQKRITDENHSYDIQVANAEISWLEKDLEKAEEELEKGTLTARHSGKVTYVADISQTGGLNGPDAVLVLISDFNDLYIEALDDGAGAPEKKGKLLSTKRYSYRSYDNKYTMIGGVRYPVQEMDYSTQEQRMIKTKETYPGIRFSAEGAPLTAGSTIPLYFSWKNKGEPVLAIGLDSLQTEGDTSYVYVRKAPGSEETERRVVEIGEKDNLYAEVLSGLSEGEEVYYEAGSVLPARYTEQAVEQKDFTKTSITERYGQAYTHCDFYYTPNVTCMIDQVGNLRDGATCEEGDFLYSISTGTKDSEVLEASQAIETENKRHSDTVNQLNREIEELDRAIAAAPDTEALLQTDFMTATDTDAEEKEETLYSKEKYQMMRVQAGIQLEQENAAYSVTSSRLEKELSRLRSVNGTEEVTAKNAGKCQGFDVYYQGHAAYSNMLFGCVVTAQNPLLEVTMMPMTSKNASAVEKQNAGSGDPALPGQKIKLTAEGKEYELTCVGINGDNDKIYVTSIGDKVYLPKAAPRVESQYKVFYASANEEVLKAPSGVISFDSVTYPDVLVIPAEAVYSEVSQKTNATLHYVWRVMPYGLDKTYVDVELGAKTAMVLSGLSASDKVAVEVLDK